MIEITLAVILGKIGDAFIGALAEKLPGEVWSKLRGDPAKRVIKQALGTAIQQYATSGLRLELARPLLQKDSFLTQPEVARELALIVSFGHAPDAQLIGELWRAAMDSPPSWCDFTYEAERLLKYLENALRDTELFRPVFTAKSLAALTTSTISATQSLSRIEEQLTDLNDLVATRFGNLMRAFTTATPTLRDQIRDYAYLINEKTYDFVGRQFVFDAITHFTTRYPRGYFFVRGDPGIGKSALAAQLVKSEGYVHHFNIRSEGIHRADTFLRNICAQLTVTYKLEHTSLPPEATQDAGVLRRLLEEISDKQGPHGKSIIVVDALDEADTTGLSQGVNVLYLPLTLPRGIYMIVTMRRDYSIPLRIECEQGTFEIKHDFAENIADISQYLSYAVVRPGIQAYIATQGIDDELFIGHLVEKSEGNFMYLYYMLPEIEHGAYTDLSLEALPAGLQNYYEDHWRRMRGRDEESWFTYKLPVVMALTVVKEAVSIDLITHFSGVQERARLREVLQEWAQFLHVEQVPYEGGLQKRYHIYHASFHDFVAQKEEIKDERVSRQEAQRKIVTRWKGLLDE